LPKLEFGAFKNFDAAALKPLLDHIQEHPHLRLYEKVRAQGALLNAIQGRVPTRSQILLLETAFGKPVATNIVQAIPTFAKWKNLGFEVWNVPRSLMASFDLSAPFRQGLVAGARHPVLFSKNFGPMVKAFGSENAYHAIMEDIVNRPSFGLMQKSRLALTDLGNLSDREEQFVSNLAERIPIAGRGVRASGRAYTGFLNKMRADVFDHLVASAEQHGVNVNDPHFLESAGRFVNSATGRGDLGSLQHAAVALNSVFFSPRLLAVKGELLEPGVLREARPVRAEGSSPVDGSTDRDSRLRSCGGEGRGREGRDGST